MFAALGVMALLASGPPVPVLEVDPAEMTVVQDAGGGMILLTTGTGRGLAAWDGSSLEVLSTEPGAGRNAFLLGDSILFKECAEGSQRIVAISDGRREVLVERSIACGPFPAPSGFLYSDAEGLHVIGSDFVETGLLPDAALCPSACLDDAGSLWFVDPAGRLSFLPPGGDPEPILDCAAGVQSCPGVVLARMIDGSARLLDPATRGVAATIENALLPRLLPDGLVLYTGILPDGASECRAFKAGGGDVAISPQGVPASRPMMVPGLGPVWTDTETGRPAGPCMERPIPAFPAMDDAAPAGRSAPEAEIDVPWMHQRWDTPDSFNGSWSCGPSSCMMAAQYYDRLTPDSIWCSSPSPGHWSQWGRYIPDEYTFLGYTYDIPGLSPGDVWVDGAHGFICRDAGGAYWSYMRLFLEQTGLYSEWAGTSWGTLTSELESSWPVVCSSTIDYSGGSYGHIILFTGYYADRTVVVNDPYGDANLTGWGQSWRYPNGKACLYDWPGYNNGHLEIGAVNQLILARHEVRVEPDTLVDDNSLGFGKRGPCQFWHEEDSGWDGSFWWTWATASPPDTCFAKWKPVLPWQGEYEVSVYIPSYYASATGIYRLSTPSGTVTVPLDQGSYAGEWASLGTFPLQPGDSLYLGDWNGQGGERLAFDAARFHPLGLSAEPCAEPHGTLAISNPCTGSIGFTLPYPSLPSNPSVVVLADVSGRTMGSCTVPAGSSTGSLGGGMPAGIYFVVIVEGAGQGASAPAVFLGGGY